MSTYDQLLEKGKIEGKLEGKNEEKIEVILRGYDNGLDTKILANITGISVKEVSRILKKMDYSG